MTKNTASNIDSIVQNIPLSFIRSGYYYWYNGGLSARRSNGYYWSSRAYFGATSRGLNFNGAYVNPWANCNKGYGFPVRCGEREER